VRECDGEFISDAYFATVRGKFSSALNIKRFWSFDDRQRKLAKATGLDIL